MVSKLEFEVYDDFIKWFKKYNPGDNIYPFISLFRMKDKENMEDFIFDIKSGDYFHFSQLESLNKIKIKC